MAKVTTTETKRANVVIEAPWGTYRENYARDKEENILMIKFSFDVLKKKFTPFRFGTTKLGSWFGIDNLEKLRSLHKAIGEALNEVENLSS